MRRVAKSGSWDAHAGCYRMQRDGLSTSQGVGARVCVNLQSTDLSRDLTQMTSGEMATAAAVREKDNALYKEAAKLVPDDSAPFSNLSVVSFELGEYPMAAEY